MKPFILAAFALAGACANHVDSSAVATAERERAAAIARGDSAAYGKLVAPDLLVVDRDGAVLTKNDRVAAVDSGEARDSRVVDDDVEVRLYGDLALVVGRRISQEDGQQNTDYFTRIWLRRSGRFQLVGAHYTDITRQVNDGDPATPAEPAHPVPVLPIATTPARNADTDVQRAIRDQHQAYWRKDTDRYRGYAALDLLRVAENGIRTRDELIQGMRGNARLPAPPSDQLDVRVRVYGNAALTSWIDQGNDVLGRPTRSRFTVVLARRAAGWQMVHIQSSFIKHQ